MKSLNLQRILGKINYESNAADLGNKIVLYILRVTGVITALKLLAVLPVYWYSTYLFIYVLCSFLTCIAVVVYLFIKPDNPKPILRFSLIMYSLYVVILMFLSDFKLNLISLQHMFLVIMIAFYGLNRFAGIIYATFFVSAVLVFIAMNRSGLEEFSLFPIDFALPNLIFVVTANFLLICYIHYYYNLNLNKTLDAINLLNKKLNASINAKSEFLSIMSHELRTPLNSVIGISYLLNNSEMNEQQRKNLHALKFSAESVLVLINDILDYSKMDSNRTKLESIPFSIKSQIQNIFSGFEPKAKQKSIDFQLSIDPKLENLWVLGDPVRFSQILYNLVGNAIKFTEEGGVTVIIKVFYFDQKQVSIRMFFNDTGIGIEEYYLPTLFEPFTQAYSNINRKYEGTGLGLAIVNHLVKLHNGSIKVQSTVGVGTQVEVELDYHVTLPAKGRGANSVDRSDPIELNAKIIEDDLSDLRVLLVEDNEMSIMFMSQLLKKWNIKPEIARNGVEAVEVYQQLEIDLILMDIHMPLLSGKEATAKIREIEKSQQKKIPAYIIALTASVSDNFVEKYLEVGFDEYLKKPFRPNDLLSKIHKGLAYFDRIKNSNKDS